MLQEQKERDKEHKKHDDEHNKTQKTHTHTHTQIQEKNIRKEEAIGLLMNSTQEM